MKQVRLRLDKSGLSSGISRSASADKYSIAPLDNCSTVKVSTSGMRRRFPNSIKYVLLSVELNSLTRDPYGLSKGGRPD